MLLSISIILLLGLLASLLFKKIGLPGLVGMIIVGIIIGPYALNLLDSSILDNSAAIRKIALIIILTRGGLSLDLKDLKRIGKPAVLMCFLPATFEIIGMVILAPILLGVSYLEALLIGSVVAAVSPAVIVPKMVKLIEEGAGAKKGIPQLILAGASVDDIYVIVIFYAVSGLLQGESLSILSFVNIPVSIILGIVLGYLLGIVLEKLFEKLKLETTLEVFIILGLSLLLSVIEDSIDFPISFSSLIAIMFIGIAFRNRKPKMAEELSGKYNQLWLGGEIFLFVLVGATINLAYLAGSFIPALILIALVLVFRLVGVYISLMTTDFTLKEKIFSMIAYTPKATVQAAIGAIPLSLGLECGNIVLTVAIIAILFTAPVGAFLIDLTYKKLLE